MTRDEALLLILREWYALPESERETEHHASVFAMKIQKQILLQKLGRQISDDHGMASDEAVEIDSTNLRGRAGVKKGKPNGSC
jgi:hypothetical protein